MFRRLALTATATLAATMPAFAHLDPQDHGSLAAGLSHPLFGMDHVLAMVAVGLWATQVGGRALWMMPAAFVTAMAGGYCLALSGVGLPFVEPAILASVIGLGLLVSLAVRPPLAVALPVVSLFALFHGYAHGGELGAAGALAFGLGFAVSTAALHVAGIFIGASVTRFATAALRLAGAATAVAGVSLAFG